MSDVYKKFLNKLKDDGYTDDQLAMFVENFSEMASGLTYTALLTELTDEDMQSVESIENDGEAEKEMLRLFEERTGKAVEKYIEEFRDFVGWEYVKKS